MTREDTRADTIAALRRAIDYADSRAAIVDTHDPARCKSDAAILRAIADSLRDLDSGYVHIGKGTFELSGSVEREAAIARGCEPVWIIPEPKVKP